MRSAVCWKVLIGVGLIAFVLDCAPKRIQTQFSKNKEAEYGQDYTPEQMRAALGADRYDVLVAGIGQDNLNALMYGIGQSNMVSLMNAITGPGKLVSLMSDGPNSKKLTSTEVLDLLLKLDAAVSQPRQSLYQESTSTDTIGKMANMINVVSVAGMEGIKNIVHGVQDQPADLNGIYYQNKTARLGFLIAVLKDAGAIMPNLVNNLAAPGGIFNAAGNAKLIRMVNQSLDMRDLGVIINTTNSLNNITDTLLGLTGNIYCSKPEFLTQVTCTGAGGAWTNTVCSNPAYVTRAACTSGGATWTPDGIDNMGRMINELDRVCSNGTSTNGYDCISASGTWYSKAAKIPVIINNISNVPNMYTIVNGLTNDGKRPAWPTGQPAPYAGDAGNIFDGIDSMVATINAINVPGMGDPATSNTVPYGLNGVLRLAYMVNQLDTTPVFENDSDFEGGTDCVNGQFDNRLNWAFTDNGTVSGSPWFGKSWRSGGTTVQGGSCSLRNDNTAAAITTATQSAELIANITTAGNMTVYTKTDTLGPFDTLRIFVNDTQQVSYTQASGGAGFQLRTIALTTGLKRIRFDLHRIPGSTGQAFIDTMVLPGTKGAARTAAEKTAIMMNNLYIQSSLTNVADLLNNVTAPGCVATPASCTPTNNNGLDSLIYAANRSEYPGGITGVATISVASPGVVTWTGHNMAAGSAIKFQTSGALPAPLAPNTIYYVKNPTANTFNLSSTPSGGTINTTVAGSGSHLAIALPRLAVTVNGINNLTEMYAVLNNMTSLNSFQQLVAMMDFVETPSNVPDLINGLGTGGGTKTASILSGLTAAGTSNMLRTLADSANDGAQVSDVADLINGATTTSHVATALSELSLSGNVYLGKSATVTMTIASPGVVTWSAHGYTEQSPITFDSTGTLPTGVTLGTTYYMKNVTTNTFQLSATPGGAAINTSGTQSGTHTAFAKGEVFFDGPTGGPSGGKKFAQFFTAVNNKSSANAQNCTGTPGAINSNFCVKFHFVRIVNDLASSGSGPITIAQIVGNLRPDTAGPGGGTGVSRMTDALFDVKTMASPVYKSYDPGSYGALSNNASDPFGRMTTLMVDMGSNGPLNMARMVNELDAGYLVTRGTWLVRNTNRIRYFSRVMSEMTSADLMIQLLNAPALSPAKINTLVNTHGDLTYGVAAVGSYAGAIYGTSPSGYNCTTTDCDTNTTDKLGRMIHMINNITQIPNTVDIMVNVQDLSYVSYLINNLTRIRHMTSIVNNLTNVDLMISILNGADACSVYVPGINDVTDTSGTCATAGGTWTGVGKCKNDATKTTLATCGAANWEGADRAKLLNLMNGMGNSELKGNIDQGDTVGAGSNTKAVGDQFVLTDTVNKLGYNGSTQRTLGQQMRVVRVINQVQYCGLKPNYDKRVQSGPVCVNASNVVQTGYQHEEACTAASGLSWKAKYNSGNSANCTSNGGTWLTDGCWVPASTMFNTCNDASYQKPNLGPQATGVYYADGDRYDGRSRAVALMLGVSNGDAFSVVVGDVQDTTKTINMVNGVRRIRTLSQFVKWTPGAVTAALVNNTHPAAVLRSLVYLANNLEDSEDETAKAFASMVHFGVKIVPQGNETSLSCLEFTGLGPRRLAAVMNLEAGPYLEGLVSNLGWQMATAAMNCGWGRDVNQNTGAGQCTNVAEDGNAGGMYKTVGGSYTGTPAPSAGQCVRSRELTAGYRYGAYTWTGSGGSQGQIQANCQSLMPEKSGMSVCDKNTDDTIWSGLSTVDSGIGDDGCTGSCEDMWSILKGNGSGLIGSLMATTSSYVGFPPPRVYSNSENSTTGIKGGATVCSYSSSYNNDNWQCVRLGLNAGDLRPGDTGNGYYWGTYCAAGDSPTPGSITGALGSTALALSCINNGGSWKTEKVYQGPSCNLDPSLGVKLGP